MTSILEIEKAIQQLPQEDYGQLRQWIEDYDLEHDTMAASAQVAQMLDDEDGGGDQFTDAVDASGNP